jgi:hypothetical protein
MIKSVTVNKGRGNTCEACGQGILYEHIITYADGSTKTFGSECVMGKIAQAPDKAKLLNKRLRQLAKYQDYKTCLAAPMPPVGSSYHDRGYYFVSDSEGKDIQIDYSLVVWGSRSGGHYVFHPLHADKPVPEQFAEKFKMARAEVDVAIENLQKVICKLLNTQEGSK